MLQHGGWELAVHELLLLQTAHYQIDCVSFVAADQQNLLTFMLTNQVGVVSLELAYGGPDISL